MTKFWAEDHPVLTLMRQRLEDGSRPGRRLDDAVLGLAVEGGGMRGVASCAMLSALEDCGYRDAFDMVFGGSSGSVNAAYFLAGQLWRNLSIYYDDLASRAFIDFRRLVGPQAIFNVDYAFDEVFDKRKPLDYEAVLASPTPLHVSITMVDTLETVTPHRFLDRADLKSAMRAGAWLPLATVGTADFRGRPSVDGGVLTAHPWRLAADQGCTHILSLSTRPTTVVRQTPTPFQRYTAHRLNRMRVGLGSGYRDAIDTYRRERQQINRMRLHPTPQPYVLDLCPSPSAEPLERHAIEGHRILWAARDAYRTMRTALTGDTGPVIPRFTAG